MAIPSLLAALLAGFLLLAVPPPRCTVAATDHEVGGSIWSIPTSSDHYRAWAGNRTFYAGDNLVFRFDTGMYDVVQVGREEHDRCTAEDPFSDTFKTSPAVIHIDFFGWKYFISTVGNYCSLGVKLAVSAEKPI